MAYRVSQAIVELMKEPVHDVPWLKRAVQAAIELELATIPPYLCARWSIIDAGIALNHVRSIVIDEMGHMGLMCNLLKGLGETPKIVSVAPRYPGPLPGGVRPELIVYLSALTPESVSKVYMEIEKPEDPLAFMVEEETFTSIGKFYEAVSNALIDQKPALSAAGQLSEMVVGVKVLATLPEALAAVERIRMQGEGTTTSPFFNGVLGHYYKFGEISHGHSVVERPPGKFSFTGDPPVPFPATLPMARVPDGGWPNRDPDRKGTLQKFNSLYRELLANLEKAWSTGNQSILDQSIFGIMTSMSTPARTLMRIPLEGGGGNYGPDFII